MIEDSRQPRQIDDEARRIAGEGGKIAPETLRETLGRFPRGLVKSVQPGVLSLSQATEAGTVYRVDEIRQLADIAHAHGVAVHIDGARIAVQRPAR